MNHHARLHMLGMLSDIPVVVGYVPRNLRLSFAAEMFLSSLDRRGWFVVTRDNMAAFKVHTVAGKGSRRRGLRGAS